ncbi:MAG: M50 family metallopeptidase [Pseudomonadota bacterium]
MVRWLRGHWQLLIITALLYTVWHTPVAWPLRMLIVVFHEMSHGIAALSTGGSIDAIELSRFEGGTAWIRGGHYFWVATAGYLGSLAVGLLLFLGAVRTNADRLLLGLCGAVMLLTTAFYVRDIFTVVYCTLTGAAMLAVAYFANAKVSDLVLRVIGLSSMLYVPWDIYVDTIWVCHSCLPNDGQSDAAAIAGYSFGSEAMWGWIWLVISVVVIIAALRFGLGTTSNLPLRFTRDPSPSPDDRPR